MRSTVVVLALVAALAGCRGKPRPVYEWEPTVTTTSGDPPAVAPPAAAPSAAAPSAEATPTTVPARPSGWLRGEKQ